MKVIFEKQVFTQLSSGNRSGRNHANICSNLSPGFYSLFGLVSFQEYIRMALQKFQQTLEIKMRSHKSQVPCAPHCVLYCT